MLSTLSLFFNIPQIYALLSPVGAGQTTGAGGTLTIVGSTANAAAKTGQILRLVRLVRATRAVGALLRTAWNATRARSLAVGALSAWFDNQAGYSWWSAL